MQSVLCIKQVSRPRLSPIAPLTSPFSARSIHLRRTCRTAPLRRQAFMRGVWLRLRLFRVAYRRGPDAVIGRRISQWLAMAVRKIGKKNDAPVVFVGKQTDHAQVESGTAKRIGVVYLTCIAEFSCQDLLCLRQSEASFGQDPGFSPSNLNRAEPIAAGAVWLVSAAEWPGPSDLLSPPASARRFSVGSASMAQTINTDEGAVIPDLASASSASSTDHFACATALGLRRAVQLGPGMVEASRLFDGTIMPAQPAARQRIRERSDAACERSEFTKHKPKSSGHGTDCGSA
ncbi:hypothetical protein [Bradyrhizobium sp. CCBAU 53415]|uniref:hypothetical protein n=1 Tax=Bradyrhizobium sp. CCBAU 53415 TaxID=1325119 RepID=UPI00230517B0|nr:hypothetical protein [Bradyrhizobium sp. CCBAU 53415]